MHKKTDMSKVIKYILLNLKKENTNPQPMGD